MKRTPLKRGSKQMKRGGFREKTHQEKVVKLQNRAKRAKLASNRVSEKRVQSTVEGEELQTYPQRIKKKGRKKRTPRQILEDKLWEECKRIIRKRYQNGNGTWTCYTSNQLIDEPAKCQTGHGKPKGALPVRFKYDLRNLRPQCYNANINLGGMSDIFIAKLEREKEGLEFLQESCVYIDGKWEVRQDQTMGSAEAFRFLSDLYEKYKLL